MYLLQFTWAFLITMVYGSFAEYVIHRWLMHHPFGRMAFRNHMKHHQESHPIDGFYNPDDTYRVGETSKMPIVWVFHLPMYVAAYTLGGVWAAWGASIGAAAYLLAYEGIHFLIHTPRGYWIERTRWFKAVCEYHRAHHLRPKKCYNIVCWIADFCFRTLLTEAIPEEMWAPDNLKGLTGWMSVFQR
jgi:hypothetical protein